MGSPLPPAAAGAAAVGALHGQSRRLPENLPPLSKGVEDCAWAPKRSPGPADLNRVPSRALAAFFFGGNVNLALQPARFANASGLPAYPQLALKHLNTFVDL